jgi:hypothetical protein
MDFKQTDLFQLVALKRLEVPFAKPFNGLIIRVSNHHIHYDLVWIILFILATSICLDCACDFYRNDQREAHQPQRQVHEQSPARMYSRFGLYDVL